MCVALEGQVFLFSDILQKIEPFFLQIFCKGFSDFKNSSMIIWVFLCANGMDRLNDN